KATALALGFMVSLACRTAVAADVDCPPDCQRQLVEMYFSRIGAVFKAGSAMEDVERLFELFHADVRYQHLDYQADFNLDEWKSAFVGNLHRGAYQASSSQHIKVEHVIFGKHHAAV